MIGAQRKITSSHLERLAIVYLRQSMPAQVRLNVRSTKRQYAIAGEAARLGWESERIVVVDGDLGVSGRDTHARESYKQLVARVCLGEVGTIFGLEISRLARNNADLLRLLEFCALTDTLVLDTDGIYDLQDFNDRLLLGLKAQMSEAELHIMAGRLQGAKRAAAQRGELRFGLPVGYVYDEDGPTITDPDQEVQAAICDVFAAFVQTGSAYGVLGVFKGRRFPKRAWGGAWAGELRWGVLRWGVLSYPRVVRIIQNPCYAGADVFGRCRSRRAVRPDGTITTKTIELPRSECPVLIEGHHPGYISWDAYLLNEQRLAANHTRQGQRPAREGTALCQGIVRCGSCGHSMTVQYHAKGAHYDCSASRVNHIQTPGCRSVKAAGVDELVARRLLAALAPGEIALALAAADEVADRRARSDRALELRVERARYDAVRAERSFHQCEPENRLVARSLETRWEAKLRELAGAEAELAEHTTPAPDPSSEQLEALARDVPALWAADSTSEKDRKRLLRALIADITITSQPAGRDVHVGVRWRTGAAEQHTIQRPPTVNDITRTPPETVELITRLSQDLTNTEIANQLADRLRVSPDVIYYWISHDKLTAHRDRTNRLRIPFSPDIEQECRERIANSSHIPQTKIAATGGAV